MWRCILAQAVPLTVAQLVQLLYNVVDRIYIGHMDGSNGLALTGVGLTFPVITLIMAFTALFGPGGVPLFSMARGAGDTEKARRILGNSFALLLTTAAEAVTRKKINPKYEGYLHAAGMILLLGLMALIMFKDIFALFKR